MKNSTWIKEIEKTADGTSTLYRPDIDEHYHSIFGAVTESRHVYIDMGFKYRSACYPSKETIRVFEVGFGTGLNAALTAMTGIPCFYTAIELYPLDETVVANLDFGGAVDKSILNELHNAPWGQPVKITPTFTLLKINDDFTSSKNEGQFDVVYMDAFAPEKQPEMWSESTLKQLSDLLLPGGILTTYCAKGHIRRLFESFGLKSERIPGPPGGKREILRISRPTAY